MNQTIQEMEEDGYYLEDVRGAGGGGGYKASIFLVFREVTNTSEGDSRLG
jgi:hypothetical protein